MLKGGREGGRELCRERGVEGREGGREDKPLKIVKSEKRLFSMPS